MAIVSYDVEIATLVSPAKMFQAFVIDFEQLFPKILPQAIKEVKIVQGDGGAGSIKHITFGEASRFTYMKHRIDMVDKDNLVYGFTVIEGDALQGVLEKIVNEIKFEASSDGGCICKSSSQYYPIGDNQIKEEDIKRGKEKAMGLFKAIEAYLLANPTA